MSEVKNWKAAYARIMHQQPDKQSRPVVIHLLCGGYPKSGYALFIQGSPPIGSAYIDEERQMLTLVDPVRTVRIYGFEGGDVPSQVEKRDFYRMTMDLIRSNQPSETNQICVLEEGDLK